MPIRCASPDRVSVVALAVLHPAIAATGHGTPMAGAALRRGTDTLVADVDERTVLDHHHDVIAC